MPLGYCFGAPRLPAPRWSGCRACSPQLLTRLHGEVSSEDSFSLAFALSLAGRGLPCCAQHTPGSGGGRETLGARDLNFVAGGL